MSASSAASSTLTRSRIAMLSFATLATVCATYWLYRGVAEENEIHASGLHRSNAVHRRPRRGQPVFPRATAAASDGVFVDDEAENDEEGQLVGRSLEDGETVVDDQAYEDEYGWTNLPHSYQRNGQNIVQLLFRVSEDATRRNAYIHRGCACNSCNMLPIRGIRYRCANCADYDLCEGCESQGLHIKTHIFYKIRVPASSFGPRHIQPVWYSGDPDSALRVLPKETLTRLCRETGFERPELDAYWEQWTFMANTDWREDPDDINLAMDRRTFERCLVPAAGHRHSAPSLIFDRMFAFYDTNKDDLIGFPEFLHGIAYRKKKDKWRKIFEGYDIDEDGWVDRKDFLRMFRSYYVLHRQIHKEMIQGAEEQQMSSTEAHRLVSRRQPLSSAFGHDGRYPRAPDPRTGEGKTVRANGDLEITDGKGIMNESSNDTGNREEIFRRDVPQSARSLWNAPRPQPRPGPSAAYWETIVNPPETMDQLPDVLRNLQSVGTEETELELDDALDEALVEDENVAFLEPEAGYRHSDDGGDTNDERGNGNGTGVAADHGRATAPVENSVIDTSETAYAEYVWPPRGLGVTDEDAVAIEGPGSTVATVRNANRGAVVQRTMRRQRDESIHVRAQQEVYERWQRRSFYTDEEEGSAPPSNWKEDDDVLARNGTVGESSKAASRPSRHSRSSSKVRFAEDMDDFDTRSNPSTSSRSVPERWGGMDIPDAERDAGKEILYQVTQQAFNELLDPLFKEKEDMALEAAKSKDAIEKWRHLYTAPGFEEWAFSKQRDLTKSDVAETTKIPQHAQPAHRAARPIWPPFQEVEVEQVRERPLEELLAATGYQVDETLAGQGDGALEALEEINQSEFMSDTQPPSPGGSSRSSREALSPVELSENENLETSDPLPHYDPTLPQFRPNSDSTVLHFSDASQVPNNATPSTPKLKSQKQKQKQKEREPEKVELYELWQMDRASKEAEVAGGWGRLGYEEFEKRVRRAVGEGRGSQMDYLGSWIEFCIP